MKASRRAALGTGERDETLHSRRIQAFNPAFRRDIETLTHSSLALEDLADSFPGLLFALATGFGTPEQRDACLRAVNEGAPLRRAAAILACPWWLRRLPPQAFDHKMHGLPGGAEFSRRIVDFVPEETTQIGPWLWAIEHGYRGCNWKFALWAARWLSKDNRFLLRSDGQMQFRLLAAWAWHAEAETNPLHRLLRKSWTPTMGLRRALDELRAWRRRIALAVLLNAHEDDSWLSAGTANGYEFVPLLTPEDFIRESEIMENCLDQFADHFDSGLSRIFAVRRKDRSVATLEIAGHEGESSMPAIRQLRGRRNHKARPEVWRATYAWLGSQAFRPRHAPARITRTGTNHALAELWLPYIQFLDDAGLGDEFASIVGLKPRSVKRSPKLRPMGITAGTRPRHTAAARVSNP